jgi:hypothetical protein
VFTGNVDTMSITGRNHSSCPGLALRRSRWAKSLRKAVAQRILELEVARRADGQHASRLFWPVAHASQIPIVRSIVRVGAENEVAGGIDEFDTRRHNEHITQSRIGGEQFRRDAGIASIHICLRVRMDGREQAGVERRLPRSVVDSEAFRKDR